MYRAGAVLADIQLSQPCIFHPPRHQGVQTNHITSLQFYIPDRWPRLVTGGGGEINNLCARCLRITYFVPQRLRLSQGASLRIHLPPRLLFFFLACPQSIALPSPDNQISALRLGNHIILLSVSILSTPTARGLMNTSVGSYNGDSRFNQNQGGLAGIVLTLMGA